MKKFLLVMFLFNWSPGEIGKIAKVNQLKKDAEKAYQAGHYQLAADYYEKLSTLYNIKDDAALLNLANAYFQLKQKDKAIENFKMLVSSSDLEIKSIAANQLGVLAHQEQKIDEALLYLKNALKSNPANETARYNYELLKKVNQNKKDDNKDADKTENNNENKDNAPSEFAKQLKNQAEALAQQRKYQEAYNLMIDGMAKDKTVNSYADFIERLKDVVEINP